MKKDALNWNACPELPPVMLMSDYELARAIHKGMAIDYSRQSTEQTKDSITGLLAKMSAAMH